MGEMDIFDIKNPDGSIKTKEEFLEVFEEIYDEVLEEEKDCIGLHQSTDIDEIINNFDFSERTVYITDEITQDTANSIFTLIRFWNTVDKKNNLAKEARKPIKFYINTPGGDLDSVLSIISTMQTSKTPIYTYTVGIGYSGGFFIGICGSKKFGMPYSSYLFHEGCSMDSGDSRKFIQRVDFYKTNLNRLKKIVLANTSITEEEYNEKIKDDWFFTAEEAKRYGVIDEIIEEIE